MKKIPRIKVFPTNSLVDEKLNVTVEGLDEDQEITIKTSVCENEQRFSSFGCFKADSSGAVDVTQHACLAGTYTGTNDMGLIWSMQQEPGQQRKLMLIKKDVTSPITVHMSVHNNHLSWEQLFQKELKSIASTKVNRWYKAMNVKREKVKTGNVRGALFTPSGPGPFPGVIDVFGSAGGLIDYKASLLASRGFCVLALAFFLHEDLPKTIDKISLDYFKESVEWFSSLPQVTGVGIGIMGLSKGAEMGFLTALHCQKIKAIASINGIPFCSFFPLRHGNELIPCTKVHRELCKWSDIGVSSRDCFVVDDSDFIPIWTTDVKVLSLVSKQDQTLNPEYNRRFHSLIPEEKKNNYEVVEYPGAGHLLDPPYSPHCEISYHKVEKVDMIWGGSPKEHNAAQVDGWKRILQFFRTNLDSVQKWEYVTHL